MKHTWQRSRPTVELTDAELTQILRSIYDGVTVVESEKIATGLVNTIYRVVAHGVEGENEERTLAIKVGQRGVRAAEVEFEIASRAADVLDVPMPLACLPAEPVSGHPVTVWRWARGRRLDVLAGALNNEAANRLSERLGAQLARLHAIPTRDPERGICIDEPGLLELSSGALRVVEPFEFSGAGLCAFAERTLGRSPGAERIESELSRALLDWLAVHADALDAHADEVCLCHADFGTENVLVEMTRSERSGRRRVRDGGRQPAPGGAIGGRTARGPSDGDAHAGAAGMVVDATLKILDWEFACAGTPYLDLGHLLRAPLLGDMSEFEARVAAGYRDAGGELPQNWAHVAQLTDLFAWLSFLERPTLGRDAAAEARRRLEAVVR